MTSRIVDYLLCSVPVPFRLSWGKLGYSRHVFITLVDQTGKRGEGEGVLYKKTHLQVLPFLEGEVKNLDEPAIDFALDTAKLDIEGKIKPVDSRKFSITREIFLEDKNIEAKIKDMLSKKTKFVKLKVGAGIDKDRAAISTVNRISKNRLKIRIDANRAYDIENAVILALWAKDNNVILFEEPIDGDFSQISKFREQSGMPVMLDESVQTIDSLKKAIAAKCFDVLNVKLTRLGGITPARKYINLCQKSGIGVYLGCSEELEIGTRAILSLAGDVKDLYGVEGFGVERLAPYKNMAINYHKGGANRQKFLINEFWGIWKTRYENLLTRIGNLTRV